MVSNTHSNKPYTSREQQEIVQKLLKHAEFKAQKLEYEEKGEKPTGQVVTRTHKGMRELFMKQAHKNKTSASAVLQACIELYVLAPGSVQKELTEYIERRPITGALARKPRLKTRREK